MHLVSTEPALTITTGSPVREGPAVVVSVDGTRPPQRGGTLTPAERGVTALVCTGASNGEIAHRLGISRHTVESHLKHIFVKLAMTSRIQLAVWYVTENAHQ